MAVSDARLAANRLNSQRSTGPKTAEGKERSRQNGLKHGLSGSGVVMSSEEVAEVDARLEELEADLRPQSPMGKILLGRMAMLSVRMERGARQEIAAIASRTRNAIDAFDEARHDEAERLFEQLSENPRTILRKLRKSPEGVDRLIDAWDELLGDLLREPKPVWTAAHLETAANLLGIRGTHARSSPIGALSRGIWGDFDGLKAPAEKAFLDDDEAETETEATREVDHKTKLAARTCLINAIHAEIAALEAHRATLDFATIELDRIEAPERALFDPSKEASLARRYEAEASRGFFKALNEFRQAEAESLQKTEAQPPAPAPVAQPPLASSRAAAGSTPRDPQPVPQPPRPDTHFAPRNPETVLATAARAARTPG